MGTQLPSRKRHSPHPIFGPCLLYPNGWMDQDATWYGDDVRWGRSSPLPKKGTAPSFLPMSGGQTAGWMKTPLGTEVDLGPGHIVLDGDPASPAKWVQQPLLFGPCLLWPRSPISATAELLLLTDLRVVSEYLTPVSKACKITVINSCKCNRFVTMTDCCCNRRYFHD